MTKTEAVRRAGSQAALARMFGITRAAVSLWGETLPELREFQLRKMKPGWFRRKSK